MSLSERVLHTGFNGVGVNNTCTRAVYTYTQMYSTIKTYTPGRGNFTYTVYTPRFGIMCYVETSDTTGPD